MLYNTLHPPDGQGQPRPLACDCCWGCSAGLRPLQCLITTSDLLLVLRSSWQQQRQWLATVSDTKAAGCRKPAATITALSYWSKSESIRISSSIVGKSDVCLKHLRLKPLYPKLEVQTWIHTWNEMAAVWIHRCEHLEGWDVLYKIIFCYIANLLLHNRNLFGYIAFNLMLYSICYITYAT